MPKAAPKTKSKTVVIPTKISAKESDELLATLEERFTANMHRHKGLKWAAVKKKLNSKKLLAVYAMELTGGEPDVVKLGKDSVFVDCSAQTPKRRSICYDAKARKERKKFPPKASAEELANAMGVNILNEKQYRALQEIEAFDTTTSSWLATPAAIRKLGGALFADRRFDHVFVYHNGADAYYGGRGFRGVLTI